MGVGGSGAPPLTGQQCIDRILGVGDYADQLGIGGSGRRLFFVASAYSLASIDTDQVEITGLPALWQLVSARAYNATASVGSATIKVQDAASLGGAPFLDDASLGTLSIAQEVNVFTLEAIADQYISTSGSLFISTTADSGGACTVSLMFEILDLT